MKTGLILEGGAMRGLFSAGIMDVMMENGIAYDGVIGVSAGAAFGCNYISGQIGRSIRYNLKYFHLSRPCPFHHRCNLKSFSYFCFKKIIIKFHILPVYDNQKVNHHTFPPL